MPIFFPPFCRGESAHGNLVRCGFRISIRRSLDELAGYLFRSQTFPRGAVLLTGTGVVPPDEFKQFETQAYGKGFLMVSATPLTRSSYHAGDDYQRLKAARDAKLAAAG